MAWKTLSYSQKKCCFNENNIQTSDEHAIIQGDTLAEGERDKIIQPPSNNAENGLKTIDNTKNHEKPDVQTVSKPQPEEETVLNLQKPQSFNSVSFPPISEPSSETKDDDEQPQVYGPGQCVSLKPKRIYKKMYAGLVAGITHAEPLDDKESLIWVAQWP